MQGTGQPDIILSSSSITQTLASQKHFDFAKRTCSHAAKLGCGGK